MTDFEKIKEMDIDEILDQEEYLEINYHIVSDSLAEYSIKRIKKATEQHDRLVNLAKEEIAELQAKIQKLDENLESIHPGLFIIGDGSGVTHSLSHASASGVHVAREILSRRGA
jgi:uncharacterized FAD-dependent dehydrogenase